MHLLLHRWLPSFEDRFPYSRKGPHFSIHVIIFFSTESSHLFLLYRKKTQSYFNCLEGQEIFQTNCNIQGESHPVRSLEVFSMMSEQVIENGCIIDYNERPSHEVFREVQKNDDKSFDRWICYPWIFKKMSRMNRSLKDREILQLVDNIVEPWRLNFLEKLISSNYILKSDCT